MPRVSISPIHVGQLNFLILDCPSDATLQAYLPVLEEHHVTDLVRICEGSPYDPKPLSDIGIKVHDNMKFTDGTAPGKEVITNWLDLNDQVFFNSQDKDRCIAVHCVSGIGRAPVLVAISLVEGGMDPLDSIAYIRKARRGALNRNQIAFLDGYKKRKQGFGTKKVANKGTSIAKEGATLSSQTSSTSPASSGPGIEKKKTGFISKIFGKK
ncbi:Protein tyrosine phosphatase type IVA 1 [Mortierella sp. AD011]|nr:Protein tyrosine phosphatase type IVA 1 [Mortierella sp. AD010]KAF9382778.1 Protein tyrosine phosphatase type IVA 1 [Mortierella sp. AD011]